jgi:hypothetical protein
LSREGNPSGRSRRAKHIRRLVDEGDGVAALRRHGQLACVDARDIDQIAEQSPHARHVAVNALRLCPRLRRLVGLQRILLDDAGAQLDAAEQIAQIVADDAEEVVAVGQFLVGTAAFCEQVAVSCVPLVAECAGCLGAFPPNALVCQSALAAKYSVLGRTFLQHRRVCPRVQWCSVQLVVGFVPRRFEHRVGVIAGPLDNEVGVFFNRLLALGQGAIGLVPLVAQALVGLLALRRIFLIAARHAYIRDRSSPSIALRNSSVVR